MLEISLLPHALVVFLPKALVAPSKFLSIVRKILPGCGGSNEMVLAGLPAFILRVPFMSEYPSFLEFLARIRLLRVLILGRILFNPFLF